MKPQRPLKSFTASSVYSDMQLDNFPAEHAPGWSRSSTPAFGSSDFEDDTGSSDAGLRTPSIFSYSSSVAPEMLREYDGRKFNNQNDVYYLPADDPEFDRLGLQHQIHKKVMGGLYPGKEAVERVLASEWGAEKAVLDVGTGSGHWAIDMAREFPHAHVVGVDLAPRTTMAVLPPNLRLEFDDANLGFPHYHGCFDVVHCRSISTGINDYEAFLVEMTKCLRPGGILIVIDGEPPVVDHLQRPFPPAYGDAPYPEVTGWFARIMHEASQNMSSRGGRVLTDCAGVIDNALHAIDGLSPPVTRPMCIPLGPWPVEDTPEQTQFVRELGVMMRQNALEFMRSLKPTLKSQGFSDATVERMYHGAKHEMMDLAIHMYTRWAYAWAEKLSA